MSFYGLAVRNVTSTHIGELQHLANRRRIIRPAVACWKGFAEPVDGVLPDGFLYVEVVLRHADIGVSNDTLDGSQVHPQRLHLADIGVSAAVWRQEGYFGNGLQSLFELVTEMSRITRAVFLSYFPDKPLIRVPQGNRAVAQAFRYRDAPVTVAGLGRPYNTGALVHVDGLLNADDRAIRFDMPGFQGQNLLGTHSCSKHQADAESHAVLRQFFHEDCYLFRGKGILPFDGLPVAHLLCETNGILSDEIVGFGLVHDLIHHSTALSQIVERASVMAKLLQHHFDVEGFDFSDFPATEKGFECTQRVFVVFLRGGHDVVFVDFKPHVGPFLEGIDHIHLNALGLGALVRLGFVFDFFLSLAVKALLGELMSLLQYRFEQIDFIDEPVNLGFDCPLDLHCTYTRDQLLVAMDFMKPATVREGVKWLPEKQLDVFFVTLNKADKDYSPTTMYNDYSINESLFHWQSQSTTADNSPTGQRYIHHKERGSKVLLFVREFKSDRVTGGAEAYTYLGTANYVKHQGSRPMNITWLLDRPIPAKFLKKTNKLVVG